MSWINIAQQEQSEILNELAQIVDGTDKKVKEVSNQQPAVFETDVVIEKLADNTTEMDTLKK